MKIRIKQPVWGVPITYLDFHNSDKFEILGISSEANHGAIERIHDNSYYNGYTRGKVVTRIESNMPLLRTSQSGGIKCSKPCCPDLYQLYWRIFIKRRGKNNENKN